MANITVTDPTAISTSVKSLSRTKYIPYELYVANLLPSSNYNIYYNGNLANAFCKPYGKNLGDQLVSDPYGKLMLQLHIAVPYNQTFLVDNAPNISGSLSTVVSTIELEAPNGVKTTTYLPISLKI